MSIFDSWDPYYDGPSYNEKLAPFEKYLRQDERQHFYDCPHEDPEDCDGDCY